MSDRPALLWLRQDLRLGDNPALAAARKTAAPVIPIYVLDESLDHPLGAASLWWLHHSLASLSADFDKLGSKLVLRRGEAADIRVETTHHRLPVKAATPLEARGW